MNSLGQFINDILLFVALSDKWSRVFSSSAEFKAAVQEVWVSHILSFVLIRMLCFFLNSLVTIRM